MNPFKRSTSTPAGSGRAPGNPARATGTPARPQEPAAPGGAAPGDHHQGDMPPPGRGQQPQAEEEVDEGKRLMPNLITKLCTKSAGKNPPKSHVENPLIEGEFPGSDPSFSPEMDQKSPEGRAGPFLGQNSPQTPGFYGSDPEFSSPNLELTMEWGGPAPDSGYKSMLGLRSPDSRRTPSPELDRTLIPGTTRGHLARCGSGSGSGSDPDLCPNSQTPPLDRAGSLKQGKASFPPMPGGRPG